MKPTNPYIVMDVETGIEDNDVSGPGGGANPYAGVPLVQAGWLTSATRQGAIARWDGPGTRPDLSSLYGLLRASVDSARPVILVGHNLNFDLHHLLLEHTTEQAMLMLRNTTMWDTASAEYYLSGQRVKTPTLDSLEAKYLTVERDVAKAEMHDQFKAGIGADKIDPERLAVYLGEDLTQTEGVFLGQFMVAAQQDQLGFIRDMMDSQLLAFVMEKEGMPLDVTAIPDIVDSTRVQFEGAHERTLKAMLALYPMQDFTPNPGSPTQVSNALLGRPTRYVVKMPMYDDNGDPLLFKSGAKKGNHRTLNTDVYADPVPFPFDVLAFQGLDQGAQAGTADKKIKALAAQVTDPTWVEFFAALRKWRDADKVYNTYAKGYLAKVCPDGQLRTSINQTVTPTNRVSSSNPNLQNIPGGD